MSVVDVWTGQRASALQRALRLTNERFAERLGTAVRTVAKWNANPGMEPMPEMQEALDTVLHNAPETAQARFLLLIQPETVAGNSSSLPTESAMRAAQDQLGDNRHALAASAWLDGAAGWTAGTARRDVIREIASSDPMDLYDRGLRRSLVNQRQVAKSLIAYYSSDLGPFGPYVADVDGTTLVTSVLTRTEWIESPIVVDDYQDHVLAGGDGTNGSSLNDGSARAAVKRLADVVSLGSRLINAPVYRLLGADVGGGRTRMTFGLSTFVEYALTMDLLEGELVDAIAAASEVKPGTLALRDALLGDVSAVLDVGGRLCCGGALALSAFARPSDAIGRPPDYVMLVQERSGRVLNASTRLAVIPKSFHQPLSDFAADIRIGSTLRREMEEELFGREDVDGTLGATRSADPMHVSRLSDPMRWLVEHDTPDRWTIECTGFGLNLVSGNYEFPALLAVHDPEFWARFGGDICANWESEGLRTFSTRDRAGLQSLAEDRTWSNEGLFALLQGLRRLAELGNTRVDSPTIEWRIGL